MCCATEDAKGDVLSSGDAVQCVTLVYLRLH
jgi:hypothetical protein